MLAREGGLSFALSNGLLGIGVYLGAYEQIAWIEGVVIAFVWVMLVVYLAALSGRRNRPVVGDARSFRERVATWVIDIGIVGASYGQVGF